MVIARPTGGEVMVTDALPIEKGAVGTVAGNVKASFRDVPSVVGERLAEANRTEWAVRLL